jgi:ElaB/YqjD/DUF883 family membrane-anchored ribosome-binding protein
VPSSLAVSRHGATPQEVRVQLQAARVRVRERLERLEQSIGAVGQWREVVRKHPVVAIGVAFGAGYLLGKWLARK